MFGLTKLSTGLDNSKLCHLLADPLEGGQMGIVTFCFICMTDIIQQCLGWKGTDQGGGELSDVRYKDLS